MNTKILVSLLVIGLTAIAIGGGMTGAFFSDTETSSGNTFTAGAIDLKVDNHCWYNGVECYCESSETCCWDEDGDKDCETGEETCTCTWEPTDLTDELFADFSDLKPGDWGEDTISFHVDSNKAWLCAEVEITEDDDVDCTEPEEESTDPECSNNGNVGDGELDNYLEVFAWADMCNDNNGHTPGDNIYTPNCDTPLMDTPVKLTDYVGRFTIADSQYSAFGGALEGEEDYYIGKAWCFGDMSVDSNTGVITCDGVNVQNDAQTDTLKLKVSFTAVQYRNNQNYECPTTPQSGGDSNSGGQGGAHPFI